jgi:putative transposon-encoded protein
LYSLFFKEINLNTYWIKMEVLVYKRRIHPIGCSLMIALPKEWLKTNKMTEEKELDIFLTTKGDLLIKKNEAEKTI